MLLPTISRIRQPGGSDAENGCALWLARGCRFWSRRVGGGCLVLLMSSDEVGGYRFDTRATATATRRCREPFAGAVLRCCPGTRVKCLAFRRELTGLLLSRACLLSSVDFRSAEPASERERSQGSQPIRRCLASFPPWMWWAKKKKERRSVWALRSAGRVDGWMGVSDVRGGGPGCLLVMVD
jgi:hypothetical protein